MKRTILINQQAVIEAGLDLDFIDLIIFDYIKDFAHSEKIVKMQLFDGIYFWVSHKKIMEDLPLLGIKTKAGIVNRIEKLINAGVLIRAQESVELGKSMYRFGPAYEALIAVNETDTPTIKVYGGDKQNLGEPQNESLGNSLINNNSQINISFANAKGEKAREARPLPRGTTEYRDCLFADSRFREFEDFAAQFQGDDYRQVDIRYYYEVCKNWSAGKGKKRKDWIATARQIMMRDNKEGKLALIRPQGADVLSEGAKKYLQMGMDDELWPGL